MPPTPIDLAQATGVVGLAVGIKDATIDPVALIGGLVLLLVLIFIVIPMYFPPKPKK